MIFYTGTHMVHWLWAYQGKWCVSRRRLAGRKQLHPALDAWVLDSGGFSELSLFGEWTVTPKQYASEVLRYSQEIGNLQWAAIQDWMCEPVILAKTGKTVKQHQLLTIRSYLDLVSMHPGTTWLPVIQGFTLSEYSRCIDLYAEHGVYLDSLPCVGLGSICRRSGTNEAARIISAISDMRISLHGFGLKTTALKRQETRSALVSSDSMAWSFVARKSLPLAGCKHESCNSCIRFARKWMSGIHEIIAGYPQKSALPMRRSEHIAATDYLSTHGDQLKLFDL